MTTSRSIDIILTNENNTSKTAEKIFITASFHFGAISDPVPQFSAAIARPTSHFMHGRLHVNLCCGATYGVQLLLDGLNLMLLIKHVLPHLLDFVVLLFSSSFHVIQHFSPLLQHLPLSGDHIIDVITLRDRMVLMQSQKKYSAHFNLTFY